MAAPLVLFGSWTQGLLLAHVPFQHPRSIKTRRNSGKRSGWGGPTIRPLQPMRRWYKVGDTVMQAGPPEPT
jgi:hypothetical protein